MTVRIVIRAAIMLCAMVSLGVPAAQALEMRYIKGHKLTAQKYSNWAPASIHLSGPVELGDSAKLRRVLDRHDDVQRIVVEQSPGGALYEGIQIAKLIYDRDLDVRLIGPAASAATVIGLGARQRFEYYTDWSRSRDGSQLLFHCAYLQGEDTCHTGATREMADVLEELTRYTSESWYELFMSTTPDTVVRLGIEKILKADTWGCSPSTLLGGEDVMECERLNAVVLRQPEKSGGEFTAASGQCWVEYARVPRRQGAAAIMTGAAMVGLTLDRDQVYNTRDDQVAVTLGRVKTSEFDALHRRVKAQTGFSEDVLTCVDGRDYVSRHNF